jgi:anti-sigma factor RsiW
MKEGGEISLDAILVAYLDGELELEAHEKLERLLKSDPSVRERLAMLSRGARPFKRTFDAVLDSAPRERLQAQLTASVTKSSRPSWFARSRRWGMAIAAGLLLAIGAGTVGYILGQSSPDLFDVGNSEEAWLDAIANQVSLYSRESVASILVDETTQKTQLARLSEKFSGSCLEAWPNFPMPRTFKTKSLGGPCSGRHWSRGSLLAFARCRRSSPLR